MPQSSGERIGSVEMVPAQQEVGLVEAVLAEKARVAVSRAAGAGERPFTQGGLVGGEVGPIEPQTRVEAVEVADDLAVGLVGGADNELGARADARVRRAPRGLFGDVLERADDVAVEILVPRQLLDMAPPRHLDVQRDGAGNAHRGVDRGAGCVLGNEKIKAKD